MSLQVCDQHVPVRLRVLRAGLSVVSAAERGKPAEARSVPLVREPRGSGHQGEDQHGYQHRGGDDAVVEACNAQRDSSSTGCNR